jgi:hypothetical protein
MMVRHGTAVEGVEKIATAALRGANSTINLLPERHDPQRICFCVNIVSAR